MRAIFLIFTVFGSLLLFIGFVAMVAWFVCTILDCLDTGGELPGAILDVMEEAVGAYFALLGVTFAIWVITAVIGAAIA
jgi:hypothetical protein